MHSRTTRRIARAVLALGLAPVLALSACSTEPGGAEEDATATSSSSPPDRTTSARPGTLGGEPLPVQDTAPCAQDGGGTPVARTADGQAGPEGPISLNPEVATGFRTGMRPVATASYSVSTAHPLSTRAACEVLADGGTAADALVTAQAVLGLVEPQSSGLGGGGFLVHYDAESGQVETYDGRETAPAAATVDYLRHISPDDTAAPRPDARRSGRSIGVPGILRLLELAHADHGEREWRDLFDPAVLLADDGFEISPRLAESIAASAADLARDPDAAGYFLDGDTGKPAGTRLTNPAYAKTLSAVATEGADAFYTGAIAEAIVDQVSTEREGITPGAMTLDDLAGYEAVTRDPVCSPYRDHAVCGMAPPSSGGTAVASTLAMLAESDLAAYPPTDVGPDGGLPAPEAVHLVTEAERLAYADRDVYIADPRFVPPPLGSAMTLLRPGYLAGRAGLIDTERSMGEAEPGDFPFDARGVFTGPEHGTTHISIVDAQGNAAALTTTIESAFGSFQMVEGFLLNNQLTDFAAEPRDEAGQLQANRVQPGKRPRSSMAPTLVFDGTPLARGELRAVVGSPGGSRIIQFVVKTLVGMLDWDLDPQQAVGSPSFGAINSPETAIGGEHPAVTDDSELTRWLTERGHEVSTEEQSSGLSASLRQSDGTLVGGADPRREGIVLGG